MVVIYTLHPIMVLAGASREIQFGIGMRYLYPPLVNIKPQSSMVASTTFLVTTDSPGPHTPLTKSPKATVSAPPSVYLLTETLSQSAHPITTSLASSIVDRYVYLTGLAVRGVSAERIFS